MPDSVLLEPYPAADGIRPPITQQYLDEVQKRVAARSNAMVAAQLRKSAAHLRKMEERAIIDVPGVAAVFYEDAARRLEAL